MICYNAMAILITIVTLLGLWLVYYHLQFRSRSLRLSQEFIIKIRELEKRVAEAEERVARPKHNDVHLILMDSNERNVDHIMRVDFRRRPYYIKEDGKRYACVSGSTEDKYFIYREERQ